MKKITESPLIKIIHDCISYFEANKDKVKFFPSIALELKYDTFKNAEEIATKFYAGVDPTLKKFVNEFPKNGYELPADLNNKTTELISYINRYVSDAKYNMTRLDEMVATCHALTSFFNKKNNTILANVAIDYVALILNNSTLTIEFGLTDNTPIDILDEVVKNALTKNIKSAKVVGDAYLIKIGL